MTLCSLPPVAWFFAGALEVVALVGAYWWGLIEGSRPRGVF